MKFVPIKWEISLNTRGLKTDVKLITKCWRRNSIRNSPDRAIKIFRPTDDLLKTGFDISMSPEQGAPE